MNSSLQSIYNENNIYSPAGNKTTSKKIFNKILQNNLIKKKIHDNGDIINHVVGKPPTPDIRRQTNRNTMTTAELEDLNRSQDKAPHPKINRNTLTTAELEALNGSSVLNPKRLKSPSHGQEQWKSSLDIIRGAISKLK